MNKLFISFILIGLLSGCGVAPQIKTEYVVRTAGEDLKTLPILPTKIDSQFATDAQVATFMSNTEKYAVDLESMIQTLINFYEAPVTAEEVKTLQPVTPRVQPTPGTRTIQPQLER